jgi:hypothetical protein
VRTYASHDRDQVLASDPLPDGDLCDAEPFRCIFGRLDLAVLDQPAKLIEVEASSAKILTQIS